MPDNRVRHCRAFRHGDSVTHVAVLISVSASLVWLLAGASVSVGPRLLLEVLALGSWVGLMRVGRRRGLPNRLVWLSGLVLLGVAVCKVPVGSQDLWSYVMQGRMIVVHHASPYVHRPAEYATDRFVSFVPPGWRSSRSPYGPLFSLLSAVGSAGAGNSVVANRLVHQGLAAVALCAAALLHARRGRSWAVPFLVLNPVCVAIVNGGHNDLLVGALLVFAIDTAVRTGGRRSRAVACGLLLAAAALIKLTAILAAVAVVVWLVRRADRRAGLTTATVAVAVSSLAYAVSGGVRALQPLLSGGSRVSRASVAGVIDHVFGRAVFPETIAVAIAIGSVGVVLAQSMRWRNSDSPTPLATALFVAFLAAAPFVLPWYSGWVLPMAAESAENSASRGAVLLSGMLFLAYTEPPGLATAGLSTVLALLPSIGALGLAGWCLQRVLRRSSARM